MPEAQLDRFMFQVLVDYPDEEQELEIVRRTTANVEASVSSMLSADEIVNLAQTVREVPIADHVARYALRFARLTRRENDEAPDFVKEFVLWGAGPRAGQYLVLAAKVQALMSGRLGVDLEDIVSKFYYGKSKKALNIFNVKLNPIS